MARDGWDYHEKMIKNERANTLLIWKGQNKELQSSRTVLPTDRREARLKMKMSFHQQKYNTAKWEYVLEWFPCLVFFTVFNCKARRSHQFGSISPSYPGPSALQFERKAVVQGKVLLGEQSWCSFWATAWGWIFLKVNCCSSLAVLFYEELSTTVAHCGGLYSGQ